MTDGPRDDLAHLDDRIATQFEKLGWRPAEPDRTRDRAAVAHDDLPDSPLRMVLFDIAAQVDAAENRLAERQDALARAVARRLADIFDRLDELVGDEHERATTAATTVEALRAATAELERVEGPVNQVAAALEGVHAALRAQSRILGAMTEALGPGGAAAATASDVAADIAALRHHGDELARRIQDIETFVLTSGSPGSAPATLRAVGADDDARPT